MTLHRERKAMRLPEYDYSMPGAYFVTSCTKNRELLFVTPDAKLAVESAWDSMLDIFANIELGEFVVMPNHIHGILWITGAGAYRLHPGTWKNDGIRRDGQLLVPTCEICHSPLNRSLPPRAIRRIENIISLKPRSRAQYSQV